MSVSLCCSFLKRKCSLEHVRFHDSCCSKPFTFNNGFMFFLLLVYVSSTFQISSHISLRNQVGLEIGKKKKCLKQLREAKKTMKPLWKVKRFELHISWNVCVPDCVVRK